MDQRRYIILVTKKEILIRHFKTAMYEKQHIIVEEKYRELCNIFKEIFDIEKIDHIHKAINHYEYSLIRDQYRVFSKQNNSRKLFCCC
jgi:hypothetical protein